MQWTAGTNAGFSKTKPWLPVPGSAKSHNVADETKDPNSLLSFYRQLLGLRHKEPALLDGEYLSLNDSDPNVLTYLRRYKDEAILVVLNMSAADQRVTFDLGAFGFPSPKMSVLLTSLKKPLTGSATELGMKPYSVLIAKVLK